MTDADRFMKGKYKNKPSGKITEALVHHVPVKWRMALAGLIRKGRPLNISQLMGETEEELRRLISLGTKLLTLAILLLMGGIFLSDGSRRESREISRSSDGETLRIPLVLREGEEKHRMILEIGPEEYTDEELFALAEREFAKLEERMRGENPGLREISSDLTLPLKTEEGKLEISWQSSDPEILNRKGEVSRDALTEPRIVILTASVNAGERQVKKEFSCRVLPRERAFWEKAKDDLRQMEEAGRTEPAFTLPESVNGISVEREEKREPDRLAVSALVIFSIVVLPVAFRILAIRREGERRRDEMKDGYFRFVNQLSLYLGAGLPVTESLRRFSVSCREKSLREETVFTLNRIRSGWSEPEALTELGRNIGLPEYRKVLALVSQNLYHGSHQLLMLLSEEEQEAVNIKKERTRKKGEEASEKLLLPTGLLLLTVIGIVVYPALVGM